MKLLVWQPVYVLGGGLHVLRSLVRGFLDLPAVKEVTVALHRRYPTDALGAAAAQGMLRVVRVSGEALPQSLVDGHDAIHVPWPHGIAFERKGIPAACVFQDTVLLDALGGHATRDFLENMERGIRQVADAYDRVILTSHYTRRRMVDIAGSDYADTFAVLPHMADDVFAPQQGQLPRGVRRPYLVYPANAAEHKNHETLLQALAKRRRRDVPVVLYGYGTEKIGAASLADQPHLNRINRLIRDRGLLPGRDFINLGYIDDATAAAVFRDALGLVMPTRAEGMGLPIHEAINAAKPVVCSDIEVLREHYEDRSEAILWVDPECPTTLAAAMDSLVDDLNALRCRAEKNRGCGQTWQMIAAQTVHMLHHVVHNHTDNPCSADAASKPPGRSRWLRGLRRRR